MGVLGYATILQEQLKDEKLRNYAQMIYNSAETSAALTQQLLSFARKGRHVTVNQDLHKLIQETLSLVRATIQTKIKVVLKLDAKKSIIPADPGQVQNAILNLVLNACDAMPEGGELVISTQALKLTEEDSGRFFEEVTAGRYLLLRISDTGQGMTSEVKKHIFEPFYTTKQEGKGTGLGLPAVFGTVKSHQGYLNFHTVENEGTSFDLYFPLADVQVEDETNSSSRGYSIHGTGNIIIIDDEPIVRKTVHTLLETLGYSVKTFQGGKEALLYFRDNWEEIDLILLDVIMPEMDGPQIFVKLKEINPAVKVLLFSAYSATSDVQAALDNGALGFIHKPILRDELSQKISQAMADQRVNNLRSLFGVKESKRVDINEEMINKMKNGIVDQFMFIIQNLEAAVKEDDTRKIDIILPSLELILRKVKIKSLAKLIKDLKADLKKEKSSPLEIILLMKQQFLQELD
jgi:CheY-like chemotaxis protein